MATLGIDLSALSPAELQRLLDSARARGEAELAQHLVAELGVRRARPQAPMAAIVEPTADPEAVQPRPAPERSRRHPVPLLLLVIAIALASATFGWWLRQPGAGPVERRPPAASAPAAPPRPAPAPVAPAARTPPPPVVAARPKPVARAQPPKSNSAARTKAAPAPSRSGLDCGRPRDRADRMVCASTDLSLRHAQMRAAYDRAIAAGADRLTLDRGQAVWRERRAKAKDRAALARLYTQRIGALDDAATDARRRSP